jgi:hypothetical protein
VIRLRSIALVAGVLANGCDRAGSTKDDAGTDGDSSAGGQALDDSDAVGDTERTRETDADTDVDTVPDDTDAVLGTDTDLPADSDAADDTDLPADSDAADDTEVPPVEDESDSQELDTGTSPYGGDVCLWLLDHRPASIPPGDEILVACGGGAACDDATWIRVDIATFVTALGWCIGAHGHGEWSDTGSCDDTGGLPTVHINCTR